MESFDQKSSTDQIKGDSEEHNLNKGTSNKNLSVKNLKETFEFLSTLPTSANDKPNWWIQHHRRGDYINLKLTPQQDLSSNRSVKKLSATAITKFHSVIRFDRDKENDLTNSKLFDSSNQIEEFSK